MGVGPSTARVGDDIVMLLGCDHPVILHKEGEFWKLKGEAYVLGFMDGKAVELWESGNLVAL